MPKKYIIRAGFTFRGDDGQLAAGGDTIELEDDVAKLHAHKLEPAEEAPKRRKQQASSAPAGAGNAPSADPAGADQGTTDPAGAGDDAGSQEPAGTDPAADPQ
jgi:hypothetical protein